MPAYPSASIWALALACGVDLLIEPRSLPLEFLVFLAGLVGWVGGIHGVAWRALTFALARTPSGIRAAAWGLAGLAGAAWLASSLDVWAKLTGRNALMAAGVLGVCAVGGLVLGILASWMQPTPSSPLGRIASWSRPMRWVAATLLAAAAAGMSWADRELYEGLYPQAHVALRLVAFLSLMWALVVAFGRRLPRLTFARSATLVGLATLSLVMLDDTRGASLQAFATRPWPSAILSSAQWLTDLDRDGYSAVLAGGDCAPFDATVHPGAREVPGNGIDDNCVLGDASREEDIATVELQMPEAPPEMDIVLITVDSLRPDHLGMYNPEHASGRLRTTPFLDRWAEQAVIFERAYSSGGWTSIAMASMLRGRYPRRLEWALFSETNRFAMLRNPTEKDLRKDERVMKRFPFPTPDAHRTLAQWMKRRGMQTAAVVNDGFSDVLREGLGSDPGFDRYIVINPGRPQYTDHRVAWRAARIFKKADSDEPLFLWAHFFGPHAPDVRHAEIPDYPDTPEGRYNHEIRFLDRSLKRLLEDLDKHRERPCAVFITSDHGEVFTAGGHMHGFDASEATFRIPMLARVPGWKPRRLHTPVSLVDLLPTVMSLTDSPLPPGLDGRDLGVWIAGTQQPPRKRILISDTWRYGLDGEPELDLTAVYDGVHKVVYDRLKHVLLAFDQRRPDAAAHPIDRRAADPLTRTLFGYVEETGGALQLAK